MAGARRRGELGRPASSVSHPSATFPLQSTKPSSHSVSAQTPDEHVPLPCFVTQAAPHSPQLSTSESRSTHAPSQQARDAEQSQGGPSASARPSPLVAHAATVTAVNNASELPTNHRRQDIPRSPMHSSTRPNVLVSWSSKLSSRRQAAGLVASFLFCVGLSVCVGLVPRTASGFQAHSAPCQPLATFQRRGKRPYLLRRAGA